MNTTAPRARAGKPYVPPMALHRTNPEQVLSAGEVPLPLHIDFVLPDDEVIRRSYDAAMNAPISKPAPDAEPDVETVKQYDRDATEIAWVGWLLIACLLCVIFSGLGYLAGRYLS